MKISIKKLEEKLGYKIKRDFKSVGFDTARICGVAFIRTTQTYAHFDWCYLEFENKTQEDLLAQMYKEFGKLLSDENFAVVEEVFLGFSKSGSLHLAKMGTMAVAQCVAKEIPYKLILAMSARAKFKINTRKYGKGKSKLAVKDWLKETLGIEINEDNCEDAVVLALLGVCEEMDFGAKIKKKKDEIVQVKNPKDNKYIKINKTTGKILSHKKTKGPYKGIKIVEKVNK